MSATPEPCILLTAEMVREIHSEVSPGTENPNLPKLEATLAAAEEAKSEDSHYGDVIEAAASYLFHLCRDQPFAIGNQAAALAACLVCLRLNGVETPPEGPEWESLTHDVAAGAIDLKETARRLWAITVGPE